MQKKVSQKAGVLMRLRKLIPCKSKLILYKTSILPHLTYCRLAWHFCKASDRRIQERAFRAIYQSSTTPYQQLLDQAKLPTLYNTRLQDIVILMYKIKNGLVPDNITEILDTRNKKYNLTNSDFVIPQFETIRHGKHSLRYIGPYLWSKLNNKEKDKPTLSSFKNCIRNKDIASQLEDGCQNCGLCST